MNLNRRLFLGRIGAASAAAAIVAPAVAGVAPASSVTPALAEIGARTEDAEARFLRADDAFKAAKAAAERLMPAPPQTIVVPNVTRPRTGYYEALRLVDEMPPRWGEAEVYVLEQHYIHRTVEEFDDLPKDDPLRRGAAAKRARKARSDHDAWMAAKERVREDTGFHAATTELYWSKREIAELAQAAFEHEARSVGDLLIQARALNTASSMDDGRNWAMPTLGPKLALAVERVLGTTA